MSMVPPKENRMNNRTRLTSLLIIGVLASGSVLASDKSAKREREMLRRMQQQVQQMQGQVSVLEQEKARLGQELDAAGKELQSAKRTASRLGRELKAEKQKLEESEKELASTREQLGKTQTRLEETTRNLNDTRHALATTEAAKRNLETVKAHNEREIALCEDKNGKLYKYGRELMERYEQKSCGDALKQKEPFVGFRQVEIENLLEEYRDRLDTEKITRAPGK